MTNYLLISVSTFWMYQLIKIISSGTDDYRRGDQIRPANAGTICETSKVQKPVSSAMPWVGSSQMNKSIR